MLYPISAQIPFAAQFTNAKAGASGLTVTVSVVRVNTDGTRTVVISVASATAATEVDSVNAKGLYEYLLAGASTSTAGVYLATFHSAGVCDLADVPAMEIVGAAWVATAAGAMQAASYTAPPTTAQIEAAVWDEVLTGHVVASSAAVLLKSAGAASDPLLNVVPGAYAQGTAGAAMGRIGTGTINVNSPMKPNGDSEIWVGYDMLAVNGDALIWTDTLGVWPSDITGATISMLTNITGPGGTPLTLAGVVVVPTGANKQVMVEPTAALTVGSGVPRTAAYDVIATLVNGKIVPLVKGGQVTAKAKPG